ncbi:MAG: hypothetical protein ACYS5W_15445 [Planctomycetota bacterium]|jgi:predicted Holliday junction resolvase-like endonuclease
MREQTAKETRIILWTISMTLFVIVNVILLKVYFDARNAKLNAQRPARVEPRQDDVQQRKVEREAERERKKTAQRLKEYREKLALEKEARELRQEAGDLQPENGKDK